MAAKTDYWLESYLTEYYWSLQNRTPRYLSNCFKYLGDFLDEMERRGKDMPTWQDVEKFSRKAGTMTGQVEVMIRRFLHWTEVEKGIQYPEYFGNDLDPRRYEQLLKIEKPLMIQLAIMALRDTKMKFATLARITCGELKNENLSDRTRSFLDSYMDAFDLTDDSYPFSLIPNRNPSRYIPLVSGGKRFLAPFLFTQELKKYGQMLTPPKELTPKDIADAREGRPHVSEYKKSQYTGPAVKPENRWNLISIPELKKYGIASSSIEYAISRGRLRLIKPGGNRRYTTFGWVKQWLDNNQGIEKGNPFTRLPRFTEEGDRNEMLDMTAISEMLQVPLSLAGRIMNYLYKEVPGLQRSGCITRGELTNALELAGRKCQEQYCKPEIPAEEEILAENKNPEERAMKILFKNMRGERLTRKETDWLKDELELQNFTPSEIRKILKLRITPSEIINNR